MLAALLSSSSLVSWAVSAVSLISLALLGVVGARAGGAAPLRPTLRVVFWGVVAMVGTTFVGKMFGGS